MGRGARRTSAARIRKAIVEGRRHELMYHVGRPGEDGYANRVLQAWGVDGHNSHTNVCSSSARLGHFLWTRRRSAVARLRQRARRSCCSRRTSRRATTSTRTRSASSKARRAARTLIVDRSAAVEHVGEGRHVAAGVSGHRRRAAARDRRGSCSRKSCYDREFVRKWVNWREYLEAERPDLPVTFDASSPRCKKLYAQFTPEYRRSTKPASPPSASSRPRARSAAPARASRRTAGARRRPATCGAGRSRAACTCSSC